MKQAAALFGFLVLVYLTATIGAVGSMNAPDFYRELNQPGWAPPGWLFGPVWTTLYTFMGIAAWLVWRVPHENRIRNLWVFVVHLAVNALWSWLFFAWYLGLVSFLWILLLAAFIIFLIREFWRVQKVAAWLLVPYLAWVSFAAVLNFTIWQLNPGVL
ncbi:MAG: tryptophan-rich sensory protein [Idiomarinaceae bacterium HL-53]|nr:MAG: tryptophan-rich sensory protein [Idiomarinaceae bacterium HL-53]CUS48057.1 TspO and MBR related proteins [Idiomarinaceae bacterium HL-53]